MNFFDTAIAYQSGTSEQYVGLWDASLRYYGRFKPGGEGGEGPLYRALQLLCLPAGETSARLEQDSYAKLKYDRTAEADGRVIEWVGGEACLVCGEPEDLEDFMNI